MIEPAVPTPHDPRNRAATDSARTVSAGPVAAYAPTAREGLHLESIVDNLPLVADMGYASVTLAVPDGGALRVIAATRTITAVGPQVNDRVGATLDPSLELEAYAALDSAAAVCGTRQRELGGVLYVTVADPVFAAAAGTGGPATSAGTAGTADTADSAAPLAIIVRDVALVAHETPGRMEEEFERIADELVSLLCRHPLLDTDGAPFATTRRPGDGVMRVNASGEVVYPSPNAVAIMRRAGYEERVRTSRAAEFPGGGFGIVPVLGTERAIEREAAVAGRTLLYRTIGLPNGAVVLVEDVTDAREQEAKLRVREATIREVHHRVKNNLQTVAALLRMQARRVGQEEAKAALIEATGRVDSMAAVHTLLAYSDFERVDLYDVIDAAVTSIRRGVAGESHGVQVLVAGERGTILDAPTVSSLAMVVTELVHNALEHGLGFGVGEDAGRDGTVTVQFEVTGDPARLQLSVADTGVGLPADFDLSATTGLGLSIVQTIVTQDLGGTVRVDHALGSSEPGVGARFEVSVPI